MATKLKLSNLHVGDVIKDYKDMCELLGDKLIHSDEISKRNSQYTKWKKYFDYSRKNGTFAIKEIYDFTKPTVVSSRDEHGGFELWCELYEFVEHEILNLTNDEKMPSYCVLRLEGLSKGNFVANNSIKPMAKYQYVDILTTFKLAKALMKGKRFEDNGHRFNYAMTIVEKKINDVVNARKRVKKTEEKIEHIDLGIHESKKVEYQPKSKKQKSEVLNKLW